MAQTVDRVRRYIGIILLILRISTMYLWIQQMRLLMWWTYITCRAYVFAMMSRHHRLWIISLKVYTSTAVTSTWSVNTDITPMNQQTLTAEAVRVCVILFVGTCCVGTCCGISASRRCPILS